MTIMVAVRQLLEVEGRHVNDVADEIMDHLVELSEAPGSQVLDSAVDADGVNSTLDVEVTVEAADLGGAVNIAVAAMRAAAIHATGGNTAKWISPAQLQALIDSIGEDLRVNRLEPVG
jgi:hypothetical protein